jgi:regulator of protease activity HflC (stomatin/prohibitin superfamily)
MMRFSSFFKVAAAALLLSATAACDRVEVGHVGIKVDQWGGDKGVAQTTLGPGLYWVGMAYKMYEFPTFIQNYVYTKKESAQSPGDESLTFQSIEGMAVNADFGLSYHFEPARIPNLFQQYRQGPWEIRTVVVKNMLRDILVNESSEYAIEDLYGPKKTEFLKSVQEQLKVRLEPLGLNLTEFYVIGNFRLPEVIVTAMDKKFEANQIALQRQNELAQAKAQAEKAIAEARGLAESNNIVTKSVTPELLQFKALEKWDGKLPQAMGGNSAVPFINLKP